MTIREASLDIALFKSNPCQFLENVIKEYVAWSPINRLVEFDDAPIFDVPTVGFADGDDPIFSRYKTIIDEFHMTPREALQKHIDAKEWSYGLKERIEHVSVISYSMPIPLATRDVERDSPFGGTRRKNHFRWMGEVFWRSLEHYVASLLEIMGYHAVAPGRAPFFQRKELADGARVNWSEPA
jgi:epoxyqueuosine reductase